MISCPLVMIEWQDSARPNPAWVHLAEVPPASVVRCVSVGWLIHDDAKVKALAPNMGEIDNANNVQVSGVIQIPTCAVTRQVELDEPALTISGFDPSSRPG